MSYVGDMEIALDEKADEQRVAEERQIAEYVAVVKQKQAEAEQARDEERRIRLEEEQQGAREQLVRSLEQGLRLTVPIERVRIELVGDFGEWYPAVEFGGITFALRYMKSRNHGISYKPHIARPCVRCGAPVWESVVYPSDLAYELERKDHAHDFNCVETRDDDDDDEGGWPAAAAAPKAPTRTERYTAAIKRRRELQFERAKEKEFATRRILANKGVTFNGESFVVGSATAAEKLVEFDEGYAAACAALTEAVIAEIGAREALRAAGGNPSKEDEES